ncbi:hypothetical protein BDV19DRAFT_398840 [Aspergillus venezuelensis]
MYSEISAISDSKIEYFSELADELANVVRPYQLDEKVMGKVTDALPSHLKVFALSLGHRHSSRMHRETLVFIHKHRRERLLDTEKEKELKRPGDGISLIEKMDFWEQKRDNLRDEPDQSEYRGADTTIDECESRIMIPNAVHQEEEEEEGAMYEQEPTRLETYRNLVQKSPTYSWLLSKIRNDCLLYIPGKDHAKGLREAIIDTLPTSPRISRQKDTKTFNVSFRIAWNPLDFLHKEEYQEDPEKAIEQAFTFTGSKDQVEAARCSDYLRRTWPSSGDAMVQLLRALVSTQRNGSVILADGTIVNISAHPSQGSKNTMDTWFDAHGTASSVAEIGEQIAWAASALQSAEDEYTCTTNKAFVDSVTIGHVSDVNSIEESYVFDIGIEKHAVASSAESCWLGLVSRPAVVEGFPIQRRPSGCPPGLEVQIGIMTRLSETCKLHRFDGRSILKSFSTLLVPTTSTKDVIGWHLIQRDDTQRVSYLETKNFPKLDVLTHHLENARHVVGWCPKVKLYAGAADAKYNINDSRLPRRCELHILSDISLSPDHFIAEGPAFSLGRKDIRLQRNGYVSKMRWAADKYLTLWDSGQGRGWLVNGASGLLHLVRASLEKERSDPALKSIFRLKADGINETSQTHHPNAALEVLLDVKNLSLEIYHLDADITFKDRVEMFYDQFEMMYDYQISGLHKADKAPRSVLEGWDFQDLICGREPVYPRHTTLHPDGVITLFGRDFDQIMKPLNTCSKSSDLEATKSCLAVTMLDLNNIMAAHGDSYSVPRKLTHDTVLHIAEKAFEPCSCDKSGNEHHFVPFLSLLPSGMRNELPKVPSITSCNDGAWFWGDADPPSRAPLPQDCDLLSKEYFTTFSDDSGLGKSLPSASDAESKSSRRPFLLASRGSISISTMSLKPASRHGSLQNNYPAAKTYKVGVVCALHLELMAVRALFDQIYSSVRIADEDPNHYALGRIAKHNYGTNAATDVASNMKRSFPSLKFCQLVGIGAGVPSSKHDIRLGDVVVSTPSGKCSGVLPYDVIKSLETGVSQLNEYLSPPPQLLMCAISELESDPNQPSEPLAEHLQKIEELKPQYAFPGEEKDQLFRSDYLHANENETAQRVSNQPRIFYGVIASGNRLMRSAQERDKLGKDHNVLCVEMEGAGIMNTFPCLIIRGICDYADSHKNKSWQNYAAASAAATTNETEISSWSDSILGERVSRKRQISPDMDTDSMRKR